MHFLGLERGWNGFALRSAGCDGFLDWNIGALHFLFFAQRFSEFFLRCFVLNRDTLSVALFGIGTRMERVRIAERWLGRIFVLEFRGVALFFAQRFSEFFLMCFVLNRDAQSVLNFLFFLHRDSRSFFDVLCVE